MELLPWRWWIWFMISFLIASRIIAMNVMEGTMLWDVFMQFVLTPMALLISVLVEGLYQLLKWGYKYINKGKERE